MVNKYLVFGGDVLIAVHNEACNMAQTVNLARILVKALVTYLKLYHSRDFKILAV